VAGAQRQKAASAAEDDVEELLLAGERALLVDGSMRQGRNWFDAAYRAAERHGDPQAMARAALGLGGLWLNEQRTAADVARVRVRQRDALSLIDPRSSLARRLRIRLTGEEDYCTGGHTAILALVDEARRAGDSVSLTEALNLAHHCLLGPEHGPLRLELADELIGEAARTARRSDLLLGLVCHTVDLFMAGDLLAGRRLEELRRELSHGDHLAVGYLVHVIDVMLSIRAGRFEAAEAQATACTDRGNAAGDIRSALWHGCQLGAIRWYQGRIAELLPMLADLVDSPMLSVVEYAGLGGLAVAAATAGDRRLATGMLARLRGRDLADIPRSSSWLMTMYCVVEAANLLADTEASARAYTLLSPFARLPVVVGFGVICLGSVSHSLGVASLTTGDLDQAARHLSLAVNDNLALGHWPAAVLSRFRLGQALALRDGPRDDAARRELALAAHEAASLGMTLPGGGSVAGPGEGKPRVTCQRRGRGWRIELSGRAVLVGHSVGMEYLAILLVNPGYEISAVELASGLTTLAAGVNRDAASAQPLLDDQAKRGYKRRLSQLQEQIGELESANEMRRAAAVRAERDWLIAELAATAGLSGRQRRFTDAGERARIAVGKAIRRALDRITKADPVIGAELRATVSTGRRCSYRPG
jgi:hypothetical protein